MKNKPRFRALIFPLIFLAVEILLLSVFFIAEYRLDKNRTLENLLEEYQTTWLGIQKESASLLLKRSNLENFRILVQKYSDFKTKADQFYSHRFFDHLKTSLKDSDFKRQFESNHLLWQQINSQIANMERNINSSESIRRSLMGILLTTSYEKELNQVIRIGMHSLETTNRNYHILEYWVIGFLVLTLIFFLTQRIHHYRTEREQIHVHSQVIERMNQELEDRVQKRTEELNNANKILQTSILTLEQTQSQLVQSERMAAVAELVTGVAHEINTPAGVCLTAMTYHENAMNSLSSAHADGESLTPHIQKLNEINILVLRNLKRIATLIDRFKMVSSSEFGDSVRPFRVKDYLDGLALGFGPELDKGNHQITIQCAEDLSIINLPAAFSQVIRNLLMNALTHGFENQMNRTISIDVTQTDSGICLELVDNGKGISADYMGKIFNPFFTSKRVQGFSGLGLNVVYNLVMTKLHGTIECKSLEGEGTTFLLHIPNQKIVSS